MATKSAVWGIDVGQCALKAIKLQAAGDKVEVLAHDIVEHEKILSHPQVDAPAAIKAAIEKFLSRNDIKGDQVAVAVPGQQTLSRFTKLPPVEPKRIPDIVRFEAGQQIPFDMDEVVWDYQAFTDANTPDVEVGIFAIRKELIRAHMAYFTTAGIEPILVQASPLAVYNAIKFDVPPAQAATILLDIGAQATDLIVMEGNTIWSRPVPIGGNAFTEALVKAFKLSHEKAEDMKRKAAESKYARQIFQAMRPVFNDLVTEIQRSIGFYTATHREAAVTKILGVGNAFRLPGLQKFMQQNLQIEVDRFAAFNKVAPNQTSRSPEFAEASSSMAAAFGLALQGLGMATITSTLLPPEVAKQIVWRKKQPWFGAAAACFAGVGVVIWLSNSQASSALTNSIGTKNAAETSIENVDLRETDVKKLKDAITRQAEQVREVQSRLMRPASGRLPRDQASAVLNDIRALKSAYDGLTGGSEESGPDVTKLAGSLTKMNYVVPRVIEVVHEAIGKEATWAADISSSTEYTRRIEQAQKRKDELLREGRPANDPEIVRLTQIATRNMRRDLWVDRFSMLFYKEPGEWNEPWSELTKKDAEQIGKRKFWVVVVEGRTTDPKPAGWLEDKVVKRIEEEGRKEGREFWVQKARLARVYPAVEDAGGGQAPPPGAPNQPPPRGRGRPGVGGPPPPKEPVDEGTQRFQVPKDHDSTTLESCADDQRFQIEVLAVIGEIPKELLPAPPKPADAAGKPANATTPPAKGGQPGRG